jgi:hypothetical protein
VDGARRRLIIAVLVLAVGACEPSPRLTQAPTSLTPTPTATATATPSATVAPTETAPSPTSIDLPSGFDAIPWARMPVTGDEDELVVTIGVLGKPATTTRTYAHQPFVWADGRAVLLDVDGRTEIVDAATGATIATYDMNSMELDGVPPNNLNYTLFSGRFLTDVARGFLYLMSANRDGVQLRRFNIDGTHEVLMAKVAPDPGRDPWYADFTISAAGAVVATACPLDPDKVADFRCRIYQAAPGGDGRLTRRFLPARASRPCSLFAANEHWLAANSQEHCRADGGPPQIAAYMSLNLTTLETTEIHAPGDIWTFGLRDDDIEPMLIANTYPAVPYPQVYPALGVTLRLADPHYSVDWYVPEVEGESEPDEYPGFVWAIGGHGPGWTLLHGFSPEYATCRIQSLPENALAECPSGPVILETTAGRFVLPPNTWGEYVPPQHLPGF